MQKIKRGFTLIELLVVVAIIAILATIVMISVTGAKSKARYTKVLSDMKEIATAVKAYEVGNNNVYPPDGTFKDEAIGTNPFMSGPNGILKDYLPVWPTPPCAVSDNKGYEYNNWNANGSSTAPAGLISISYSGMRNVTQAEIDAGFSGTVRGWSYYYNVKDFNLVNINNAYGSSLRGTDILTIPDKKITCSE